MNLWIVQAQENPAQERSIIGRRQWRSNSLCEVLSDQNHTVTRWRSSFSHQAKEQLVIGSQRIAHDNYHHQFIDSPDYQKHVGIARIRNHHTLGRNFYKLAMEYQEIPDLIHVGNVPIELCHAAVRYGKKKGIPVVVDVRDLWPDLYLDLLPKQFRFFASKVLNAVSFRLKYAFRDATAITALTQSYLEWGLEKAARKQHSKDAVFPMCYPAIDNTSKNTDVTKIRTKLGLKKEDILACYFGNIGYQSDFETIVSAARILQERQPAVKFIIAGSGPRMEEIQKLAKDLPNVIVSGWLQGDELQALFSISTFGLIIYNSVPNFLRNIPNKFSEYLAGGQVIICGLMGEMGNLVQKSKCGIVYTPQDSASLVNQIEHLSQDPKKLKAMSAAALKLHKDQFDGSQLYDNFATYLTALASEKR